MHFVEQDFSNCDLLIILGTSLVVQPFASLSSKVPDKTPRLYINLEASTVVCWYCFWWRFNVTQGFGNWQLPCSWQPIWIVGIGERIFQAVIYVRISTSNAQDPCRIKEGQTDRYTDSQTDRLMAGWVLSSLASFKLMILVNIIFLFKNSLILLKTLIINEILTY